MIVINGNGGAGKDTLCEFAEEKFNIRNVSAITPIKEIAQQNGWDGEKDAKSRKFLADLKQIFVEYNDLPLKYLMEEYHKFQESEEEIMFVHIREGEEIDKFRKNVDVPCVTLLVSRQQADYSNWRNASDDNVSNYVYDYHYQNNKSLQEAEGDFLEFISKVFKDEAGTSE